MPSLKEFEELHDEAMCIKCVIEAKLLVCTDSKMYDKLTLGLERVHIQIKRIEKWIISKQ